MIKQENAIGEKSCNKCKENKTLDSFSNRKGTKDNKHIYCRLCVSISDKIFRKNNPDKVKSSHNKYYQNNKDYVLSYAKNYNDLNKKKRKQYNTDNRDRDKEYLLKYNIENRDKINQTKSIYKDIPKNKLMDYMRTRVFQILKSSRTNKNNQTIKYLGCIKEEFQLYIELRFKPEMNWSNWGIVWELDHIIPLSSYNFDYEEDLFKAFHYSNHQPLFKTTEIAKSFGYMNEIGNRNKFNKL